MYQFVRNTLLITAAAVGTVEYAANINRGESFESDVLQVLRNGELNPESATTLIDAIARDPIAFSEISRKMYDQENVMISRLVTPYNDHQWVIGIRGDSVVINNNGINRMVQGQLMELDGAAIQNLSEADLFLISHSLATETRFDQTSAPIFTFVKGTEPQRCRIVEIKGAVVDTLKGAGFRSLKTTRVEIYGEDDNWLGYYSFTDTPVYDMINGVNPHGIFFPGLGRKIQFIENEVEARQLLDLALSNCK